MKMLKKLALVSAVSMISAGAFAMEAMDDESMASATGQDGVTIALILPDFAPINATNYSAGAVLQTLQGAGLTNSGGTLPSGYKGIAIGEVRIHDDDGIAGFNDSGALVIGGGGTVNGVAVTAANDRTEIYTNQANAIVIKLDMVGDGDTVTAGKQAMLNVNITTPTLQIKTGAIYVANSTAAAADISEDGAPTLGSPEVNGAGVTSINAKTAAIASSSTLTLGNTTINIQLGAAEAQGHMILVNTSMNGGLTLNNSKLNDNAGTIQGGSITMGSLSVTDAGGTNLQIVASVDVGSRLTAGQQAAISTALQGAPANLSVAAANGTALALQDVTNGLVLGLGQLGTVANGIDISMTNVMLGDANITADIGDVQMLGLNLNGTEVVVVGH